VDELEEKLREAAIELGEVRAELPVARYRAEAVARILLRVSDELREAAYEVRREAQ
jgi:hypothetical protein